MMMHEPLHFTGLRGSAARNVPLAKYTSWRAGGPADTLYLPADRDDLAMFLRQLAVAEPVTVLGLGSNTLVRDGGVRGAVDRDAQPGRGARGRRRTGLCRGGCREPEARALRGDARMRRSGIPGRRARHRRRRARDERRMLRRRDVALRRARRGAARAKAASRCARLPTTSIGYRSVRRADGSPPDGIFTAAWFRFPLGDVGDGARAHQGAARAAHRDAAVVAAQRRQRVPQSAGRSRGAAHRVVRTQGLRDRRRARVGEARQLHRQSRRQGARRPTSRR